MDITFDCGWCGQNIVIDEAGASRSKEFAHGAAKQGAVVIDNSSAFRMPLRD